MDLIIICGMGGERKEKALLALNRDYEDSLYLPPELLRWFQVKLVFAKSCAQVKVAARRGTGDHTS
jgi:hypothetical protein